MFQPFNQADTSISRRYGGTGLGLVITQKLVQQMDGSIEVDSSLEQGSRFTVTLGMRLASQPHDESRAAISLQDQSILLVEADPWSRAACEAQLQEWRMQVTSVGSLSRGGQPGAGDRHHPADRSLVNPGSAGVATATEPVAGPL